VLGLDGSARDADWPVQIVSTGLPTIVAPLADRTALTAIDVDRDAYDEVTSDRDIKNVLAFCLDPRSDENDVAVRVFAPFYGVPEDPATGSSNGCLAGYLARHRYTGSDNVSARVEQGYEMGRPSLIELATTDRGDEVEIEVSGRVVPVARGRLVRWRLFYRIDGLDSKKAPIRFGRAPRCRRKSKIFRMTKELRSFEPRSSRCLLPRASRSKLPFSVPPHRLVGPRQGGTETGGGLDEGVGSKHRNAVRSAATAPSPDARGFLAGFMSPTPHHLLTKHSRGGGDKIHTGRPLSGERERPHGCP